MTLARVLFPDAIKETVTGYLNRSLSEFFCMPANRWMLYAVLFLLTGVSVFGVLTVFDYRDDLIDIPLKFMGIHAWHAAGVFATVIIIADTVAAYLCRPWGGYAHRTVGKTWAILFCGFVLGFLCDRFYTYRLMVFYDPALFYIWEYVPSTRAGAWVSFALILPFWLVSTATAMTIITGKQRQTEELLRVRLETILVERARCPVCHRPPHSKAPDAAAHLSLRLLDRDPTARSRRGIGVHDTFGLAPTVFAKKI